MDKELNDIVKQRQYSFTFTFEHQSNNLIINAKSDEIQYKGGFQSNPFVPFDNVIKMLESSQFEIVEKNAQKVRIRLGGLIQLKLLNQEKIALDQLKQTVRKMAGRIEKEVQKNKAFQESIKLQQAQIQSLEKKFLIFACIESKQVYQDKLIKELSQNVLKNEQSRKQLQKKVKKLEDKVQIMERAHQQRYHKIKQTKIQQNYKFAAFKVEINQLSTKIHTLSNETLPKFIPYQKFFFAGSQIVENQGYKFRIRSFFPNKRIRSVQLLYRASDHGFEVKKFHEKCDNIPNTLFLCETEFDRKIGGFTPLTWGTEKPYGEFKTDHSKESFIFSLSCHQKFLLNESQYAIFTRDTLGPTFGKNDNSNDLWILDKADKQKNNGANICGSYLNPNFKKGQQVSWQRFCGNKKVSHEFQVKEWEMWKVEFAE